jgi:hypothetical protein
MFLPKAGQKMRGRNGRTVGAKARVQMPSGAYLSFSRDDLQVVG